MGRGGCLPPAPVPGPVRLGSACLRCRPHNPGDLLFYYSPISHVGIYLGGGQIVHAPNTGSVVNVASVNWSKVSGVGRPG